MHKFLNLSDVYPGEEERILEEFRKIKQEINKKYPKAYKLMK